MIQFALSAFAIALVLASLWYWQRKRSADIAAVLWLLYACYEALMYTRVLCSGECDIRVDLILIGPVLLVLANTALINTGLAWYKQRRA